MTFDYLSSVRLQNITSIDNSLTLINYIRTLNFIVDGFTCGNTEINTTGKDHSCLTISKFSNITFELTNSTFFNKNLTNNYVIEAISDEIS